MTASHIVEDQSAATAFLADPAHHGGQPVVRIDTHGAMVFLAGDRAYKLKRAVDYPYMDLSSLALREAACHAEIVLNRRTAPDLYLEARAIRRRPDGALEWDGEGPAVDWVVVMRRFDQDGLFDRLAARGALTPDLVDALADEIAAFHENASRHGDGGASAAMRWVAEDNVAELKESPALFAPDRVARLSQAGAAALDRVGPALDRRAAEGFVRRCHGDLHLRNVCLIDGRPIIFDCIEFNDALATIDVLYDLAFLLMDLDHAGLREMGNRALNRYLSRTGDYAGLAALPLFLSARAAVRAKVGASMAATAGEETDGALGRQAAGYLDSAIAYLNPPPPFLIAVGGLSGTGKTEIARRLAPGTGAAPGAVILRSDVFRKRAFGVPETQRLDASAYRPEVTADIYGALETAAGEVLAAGHAAIADAVFADPAERAAIEDVAKAAGVPFVGIWLEAPEEVLKQRVGQRVGDASDADARVVARQAAYDIGPLTWSRVDASPAPDRVAAAALEACRPILGRRAAALDP
ncbi:MAG: AAA family ATPase [Inquilinaceae bacterium]